MGLDSNSSFVENLSALKGKRVLIAGDVMLDEHIIGEVHRISPEAPVPVVCMNQRIYAPGGAANVAANVAALSGRPLLCGVVGQDFEAERLRDALVERGVDPSGLVSDKERPTTTKTRIIAHSQQVVRVDSEKKSPVKADLEDKLFSWIGRSISKVDACILSDYGKGVVAPDFAARFIELAERSDKPVIVDPKGTDYSKYRGATVITPNIPEAVIASGIEVHSNGDLQLIWDRLSKFLGGSALLITQGAQGMSLFRKGESEAYIPTVAKIVYDVTGAGDTVVSTLALALAAGFSLEDSAVLANQAAGIVVGKLGTSIVTLEELSKGRPVTTDNIQAARCRMVNGAMVS